MTDDAMTGAERSITLPDIHRAELDRSQLAELFGDIQHSGADIQARVKGAPGGQSIGAASQTLSELLEQLLDGSIQSVQLSYTHNGARWIDTIRATGATWQIVRIQAVGQ
ncbi:MAG: hypothetical protein RLN60_03565 [Phycisphaerales bacterium]